MSAALLAACSEATTPKAEPIASVTINPSTVALKTGETSVLTAAALNAAGRVVNDSRPVTWSSGNASVATVSNGTVTAMGPGVAGITATIEGRSATAQVTVVAPVASVVVGPSTVALAVGGTATLVASAKDAAGATLTDRAISWASSNNAIATVSAAGVVTALASGTATITATSEGRSGSAMVTVSNPVASVAVSPSTAALTAGTTTLLSAVVRDAGGQVLVDRPITWSSGNPSVAMVSQNGLVTAVAVGTASITATSEGRTGNATITVTSAVASVTIAPQTSSLQVGGSVRLSATARDAGGTVLSGRVVDWASSNPTIANLGANQGGDVLLTAVSPGSATITATIEGRSATLSLTVTPAAVTLTGRVIDQDSIPLANATVEIRQNGALVTTVTSNTQGVFTRASSQPGLYEIRARRFGYLEGQATYDLSATSPAATVRLSLDHRPVAGFVNPTMVEGYSNGVFTLSTDILINDEQGELLDLAPEAFSFAPTSATRTFERLSVTMGTTPTNGVTSTMLMVGQSTSVVRDDTLGHRLRIARNYLSAVNGGGQLVALSVVGLPNASISRVFGNGFTTTGASLFPSIDSLAALGGGGGGGTYAVAAQTLQDYLLSNTPASKRFIISLGENNGTQPGSNANSQRGVGLGITTHAVGFGATGNTWAANVAHYGNGVYLQYADFRQLYAVQRTLQKATAGGLRYYRIRWRYTAPGSASQMTVPILIQTPRGVVQSLVHFPL